MGRLSDRCRRATHYVVVTAAVLFVLVAAAPSAQGLPTTSDSACRATVLSDADGAISEILLHYDGLLDAEISPVYEALFKTLSDNLHIRVLCPTGTATSQFIDHWASRAAGAGRELSVIEVDQPISIWSRDRYIIRRAAEDPLRGIGYIPPDAPEYYYEKSNELKVFAQLGELQLMPRVEKGDIHLEGGNIVANNRHAFIGCNILDEHTLSYGVMEFVRQLEQLAGKPVLLMGDPEKGVPYSHIDMYLTPIDDKTVLLGSPLMAMESLVNRPSDEEGMDIAERLVPHLDDSSASEEQFEMIGCQLRRAGYKVLRIPALVDEEQSWMISYNNVLIDNQDGFRTVYLPAYEIPALDCLAADVYRRLGFRVIQVDVSAIYEWGGAVRCVVNVTQRAAATLPRTPVTRRRAPRVRLHRINGSTEAEELEVGCPG